MNESINLFVTTKAAYQQLSTDQRVIRKEFGKEVRRILLLTQIVLNDLHISFRMSSGTLLGIIVFFAMFDARSKNMNSSYKFLRH